MHDIDHAIAPKFHGEALLRIESLSHTYANGRQALDRVELNIAAGDRVALVGQNGAGKTTLAKHLNGLLPAQSGRICYDGRELTGDHLARARFEIGLLFQDPDDQLFCNTLYEDVAFGPLNQGSRPETAAARVRQALQAVDLAEFAYKAPHHLSYGQKKRAALATLLAMEPRVLILDEPTANLDPRQEEMLLELMNRFTGTLVCISHDLPFLYQLCTRAVVLQHGRVHHDYTLKELISHPPSMRQHGLDFTFRFSCCGRHAPAARPETPESVPLPEDDPCRRDSPGPPRSAENGLLFQLRDYRYTYGDGTRALQGIDLDIESGESLALVGENGAGKSTLLACLSGMRSGVGTYRFAGIPVRDSQADGLWRRIGIVFQDTADQLFCASCYDEVAFGPAQMGLPEAEIETRVRQALAQVELSGFEHRVPLDMSGGERKRLAIASVLSMNPDVLILDEPTAGLDPRSQEMLLAVLQRLPVTKILVSHDMFFIAAVTRRCLVMHRGKIIKDYPTRDFLTDEALSTLNQIHYTYKNRCCTEILGMQDPPHFHHAHSG